MIFIYTVKDNIMRKLTDNEVLEKAKKIMGKRYCNGDEMISANAAREYFQIKLGGYRHEVFAIILLNNQNKVLDYKEMFHGTDNKASVYPKEVAKYALLGNATNVIISHNHPSGLCEPSEQDKKLTKKLVQGLALLDITVLDHIIVALDKTFSFESEGIMPHEIY